MVQRVAIVQRDISWQNVAANLVALEELLEGVTADVVVLSEMFQTGFVTEPKGMEDCGDTLDWMRHMARRMDAAVVGSIVVREDGDYRNRMYFVKPDGGVDYYDKWHLFSVGGENRHFKAGRERKIVEWRGVRYLLAICYDLRFPVWSRQRGDYDAIIYSALWPAPRREVWRVLLRARAIENQAWVIGVNRTGVEPELSYVGDSSVIDYRGSTLLDLEEDERVAVVEIDAEAQRAFQRKFNVGRDADGFEIKC